jgi:cell division protein FtsB
MRRWGDVARSTRLFEQLLPALLLTVSAVSVPAMMLSPAGLPRLRALKEEKAKVDLEVSRLGDQIRQLRAEVRHIKDDPAKLEQVARDQLGLLRQTELVFQFGE